MIPPRTTYLPWIAAAVSIIVGVISLVGWISGVSVLQRVVPAMEPIQVNVAVGFVGTGLALALLAHRNASFWRRVAGWFCTVFVMELALVSLVEHLAPTGQQLDGAIPHLLQAITGEATIGRMSIPSAIIFLLLTASLLQINVRRWHWPAELPAIVALFIGLLTLTGDAFRFTVLPPHKTLHPPVPAILTFILLAAGILVSRPDRGWMAVLNSERSGGILARRLLPFAVLVPFVLGWTRLVTVRTGLPGPELGLSFYVLANMVVLSSVVMAYAATLNRVDERRSQAERELLESAVDFRGAFEDTNIPTVLTDLNHRFVRVNAAFSHLLGYSREELLQMTMTDITHPDDLPQSLEIREHLLAGQAAHFQMEKRYYHKEGFEIWGLVNVALVRDDQGRPLRYVGQVQDITERKRAEEAIATQARRLRLLHQIDRALIKGEDPEVITAAALPLLRDLLGVGRTIVNMFDLEKGEVEWLAAAGRRRVRAGPGVRYPIQFMGDVEALKRGETQWIDTYSLPPGPEVDALLKSGVDHYIVVPMIASGELIGALSFGGSSSPITADQIAIAQEVARQFAIAIAHARLYNQVRRHATELEERVRERTQELAQAHERLTAANAELKAANAELEAFSYSVSHDLRAPLRAIDGFSRMLQAEYGAQMSTEGQELLRDIRANARQMGQLVDDLLGLARLGRQPLRTQLVQPRLLVDQCLEELQPDRDGRDIEIIVEELPPCQADPSLLKQVWMNLLSNAIKYSKNCDKAKIVVGTCEGSSPGECVYFVKDNGVGFDMRYAHKLFGVFQRLHRAEDYEGTGVGLAIVQRVVQRHGGRVWAEAEPGKGATFSFTLDGGFKSDE